MTKKRVTRVERHEQVKRLKDAGLTFKEIADYLRLAFSTVTSAYYDPTGDIDRARKRRHHGTCIDCGADTFNSGSVDTPERCVTCFREHQGLLNNRRAMSADRRGRNVIWTDDDKIAALMSVARDGLITPKMYKDAYNAAPEGRMPSFELLYKNGWHRYIALAGLRAPRLNTRIDRTPEAGVIAALEDCRAEIGKWPSYGEYEEWAKRGGAPSGQTARNRFGSWMAALDAAVAQSDADADVEAMTA